MVSMISTVSMAIRSLSMSHHSDSTFETTDVILSDTVRNDRGPITILETHDALSDPTTERLAIHREQLLAHMTTSYRVIRYAR